MIIKESELRSIIKKCIKNCLNEGYSSKLHQEEIINIAKEMYNELFVNGKSSYQMKYQTQIDEKSWRSYTLNCQFGKKENADNHSRHCQY